jgi:ADP-ribosylglycohydrolase
VALFANSLEEALELARITAMVTHNHPEGVKGALAVAECVFICREAVDMETAKEEIRRTIPQKYGYNLNRTLDEIRPNYKFDVSCQGSVPEAIIAFLESTSLEDCVRNAVSIGGDSDTIAAIACSIYAARKSIAGDSLMKRFEHYLSHDLLRIMDEFERRVNNRRPIENSYEVTKNIYAGEYPRNKDDESSYAKIRQFESFGITHFIDLTEEGELQPYEPLL